jgi:hypothetical protein
MMHFVYVGLGAMGLLAGVLGLLELGRRIGVRHGSVEGLSVLEGFIYSLLGLLLAFTFNGAAERFNQRRRLIIDEANAMGTAYRRVDLVPAAAQPAIRQAFRDYVDARAQVYRKLPDIAATEAELVRIEGLKDHVWKLMLSGCREASNPSTFVMIVPALTEMFDAADLRTGIARVHPPFVVYLMLVIAMLVSSLLAGYGLGSHGAKSWLHFGAFAGMLVASVYVIVDLEYPRAGLIRVDSFDEVLRDVGKSMK